jgi:hypothetical protein
MAGGRRDGENSGRSRVADIEPSGITHNGFPISLGADWCGFALTGDTKATGVAFAIG